MGKGLAKNTAKSLKEQRIELVTLKITNLMLKFRSQNLFEQNLKLAQNFGAKIEVAKLSGAKIDDYELKENYETQEIEKMLQEVSELDKKTLKNELAQSQISNRRLLKDFENQFIKNSELKNMEIENEESRKLVNFEAKKLTTQENYNAK
jgi:hypothetical protein